MDADKNKKFRNISKDDDIFKLIEGDKLFLADFEKPEPVYELIKNLIIDPPPADSPMRLHRFTIDGDQFCCYDGFFQRDVRVLITE